MADIRDELNKIEEKVLFGLKDFQRATVERIDELYREPNNQKRILVSDEVGLGKTLVARGVIAKFLKWHYERARKMPVKIVYICSNGSIAGQNLNKLKITQNSHADESGSSRLSMQHLKIFQQEYEESLKGKYIQLIPLTPDTSFRMTKGAGTVTERALMFAVLKRMPGLKPYTGELNSLMRKNAPKAWDDWVKNEYEKQVRECDKNNDGRYLEYMLSRLQKELTAAKKGEQSLMHDLITFFNEGEKSGIGHNEIINRLRSVFAKISVKRLEPDLVIMDEFQRFRFLLDTDDDSDIGILRKQFFGNDDLRILLLSATPYKMYSTLEEIDESQIDEHYSEFFNVMKFLNKSDEREAEFEEIWSGYSMELKSFTHGETSFIQAKKRAEDAMYRSVCRTERISAVGAADIINDDDAKKGIEVEEQDIKSYVQAQKLLDEINLGVNMPVDYIKSTPYIMSFMKNYQLKRKLERYFEDNPDKVGKIKRDTFWIKRSKINDYKKIPPNNARLSHVMDMVIEDGSEKLLWVPPSKPYYEPQGVFKGIRDFTKTLVFSAWEMVPTMIASMISYEAERLTLGALIKKKNYESKYHYFRDEKKRYPTSRLSFKVQDNKMARMNLFCLLYPSKWLADLYDPIECMKRGMSLRDIENSVKSKIRERIKEFPVHKRGKADATWYYMLPMLIDGEQYVCDWIEACRDDVVEDDDIVRKEELNSYEKHVDELERLFEQCVCEGVSELGSMPHDLVDILTNMAIASPAVCIERTYRRYGLEQDAENGRNYEPKKLDWPTEVARALLHRLDTPESIAVIDIALNRVNDRGHWKKVLRYSKDGNFQAVMDEYAHLIVEGIDDESKLEKMHSEIKRSMNIRTTAYDIDTFNKFKSRVTGEKKPRQVRIRTHFAVAFTKGEGRESDNERKKVVRNAFNSPFRPFVLASTSIGQEGLDFHNYCRRIVHWNLPSNPIDLEQREGRINRYKCLAIRQNVAKRYGDIKDGRIKDDIWKEMFEKAEEEEKKKAGGGSDLIPFWGLTKEPDMVKIERVVPMYPFSRDVMVYERLIKILSLYRLTLGQARQEELLEHLFKNIDEEEQDRLREMFINLSPYYKK